MSKKNKPIETDQYINWVHKFGRIGSLIAILYMFAIPTILGLAYNIMPSIKEVAITTLPILLLFMPVGIAEILGYSPILGSASYLTFLTGNILNLKVPCVLNAQKLTKTEPNTPEGDAVSTLAVAVSSIITMIIIALGALLLVPLQPLLNNPFVHKATQYMLPALFGGMFLGIFGKGYGKKYVKNKTLVTIIPIMLISTLTITGVLKGGLEGIAIILMLPIIIGTARILWKKGIIDVVKK